jgi:hypothetical protein
MAAPHRQIGCSHHGITLLHPDKSRRRSNHPIGTVPKPTACRSLSLHAPTVVLARSGHRRGVARAPAPSRPPLSRRIFKTYPNVHLLPLVDRCIATDKSPPSPISSFCGRHPPPSPASLFLHWQVQEHHPSSQ